MPESMLALQVWLNAIESAWPNLNMNNGLKAAKMHVKYHVLFAVSALINAVNRQATLVVSPGATIKAHEAADQILPMAANCIENAMQNAVMQVQTTGKVFSPQNWLKSNTSLAGGNARRRNAGWNAGRFPDWSGPIGKDEGSVEHLHSSLVS